MYSLFLRYPCINLPHREGQSGVKWLTVTQYIVYSWCHLLWYLHIQHGICKGILMNEHGGISHHRDPITLFCSSYIATVWRNHTEYAYVLLTLLCAID